MSKYVFTYFRSEALGEHIRMLLSYGKVEFEDVRINFEKDWVKFKKESNLPLGQLPILEIDGMVLNQSLAISRFLANKFGIAGKNDLENYQIDNAVYSIDDLRAKLASAHYETNEEAKKEKFEKLKAEFLPFLLGKLEAMADENNGHFALKRFTWADVYFTGMCNYLSFMAKKDLWVDYPNLRKVIENTKSVDGIKQWVEKRPKQDFHV